MRAVLALPCAATTCRHASASAVLSSAGQRATHVKNNTPQLDGLHHRSWRRRVHTTGLCSPKGNRLEGMGATSNLVQKEQTRIRCCAPREQHLSRNTSVHGLSAVRACVTHTGLLPSYWSAVLCCPACNKKPCSSAATATCNNPLCWLRCLSTHQCSGQVPIRCSKTLGCCKAQPKTSMACPVNAWALQCSGGRTSKRSAGDTEKGSGPALDAMAAATPVRNTPAPTTMSQLEAAAADCCWQSCLARLS